MFNTVSLNVQKAWENREALGIDQSKQVVEQLFPEVSQNAASNPSVDISGLNKEDVQAEIEQTEEEIATLSSQKADNDKNIQKTQQELQEIKKQINDAIENALKESQEFVAEQSAKILAASVEIAAEYVASNGEMTKEEMKQKLSDKLGDVDTEIPSSVLASLTEADGLLGKLCAKTQLLSNYCAYGEKLSNQITCKQNRLATLNDQLTAIEEAEEARKCDPIGFVVDGKICDFIIDRNNDGKFNNETEFLGAQNNWFEMISLDQNGNNDGKVSREEMENANVKVLVTNEDGSQQIVSVADLGIDEIDLSSYQSSNQSIGNNNQLLGTFGLTLNGKYSNDGYNTLDTVNWLDKNYSNMFTDKAERVGRFATEDGLADSSKLSYNISEDIYDVINTTKRVNDTRTQITNDFTLLKSAKIMALNLLPEAAESEEDEERRKRA
ncbi:TPA: hypothetical protein IAD52_04285 [Candidatus Spyradomonas excrementavium]|nr:hypothetical protein [Candidatus Spyradomonas excrementavium]